MLYFALPHGFSVTSTFVRLAWWCGRGGVGVRVGLWYDSGMGKITALVLAVVLMVGGAAPVVSAQPRHAHRDGLPLCC